MIEDRAIIMGSATLMRDLNSNDKFVKGLERYAVEMFRVLNGIEEDNGSIFLNWSMTEINTRNIGKLKVLPEIALALRACLLLGVNIKFNNGRDVIFLQSRHSDKSAVSAKKVRTY